MNFLGRKIAFVDMSIDGETMTPIGKSSIRSSLDRCSVAELIGLRVKKEAKRWDGTLAPLIGVDLSRKDAVEAVQQAFSDDRFSILVDGEHQLLRLDDDIDLTAVEFIAFIKFLSIPLDMLLRSEPSKFRNDIGHDLLNRMLAEESQDGVVWTGGNDIFHHHPEIAREILALPPEEQGDILARIAIAMHHSGVEPHFDKHDFRRFGYDAERLFCLSKEIAKRDKAVMSSADAALILQFMCDPDGDLSRDRNHDGDPDAVGFHPDWEGEEVVSVWPMVVMKAVERNDEEEYAFHFLSIIEKLAEKWDRNKDGNGEYIRKARRQIATLRGEKFSASAKGPWGQDYIRGSGDLMLQDLLPLADGEPLIQRILSWRYVPLAEKKREDDFRREPTDTVKELTSEPDPERRSKLLGTIHRIFAFAQANLPPAQFENWATEEYQINKLQGVSWQLSRKPVTFTPEDAVDVLRCKPVLTTPALARNIARAIGPDTPGAREAIEALASSQNGHLQGNKDVRKSLDTLRAAVFDVDIDGAAPDLDQLQAGLHGALEVFALFTPALCDDPDQWHAQAKASLAREVYDRVTQEVTAKERWPAPPGISTERERWVRSTALKNHRNGLESKLPADIFELARLGDDPDSGLQAILDLDADNRAFWSEDYRCKAYYERYYGTDKYGSGVSFFRNARQPNERLFRAIDACRRRCAFYVDRDESTRTVFRKLETFCADAPTGTKPSNAWRKKARAALSGQEQAIVLEHLDAFLASTDPGLPERVTDYAAAADAPLGGLVWMMTDWPSETVAPLLTRYALTCYTSEPGRGIKAEKLGNACLWALQALPDGQGTSYLARIAARVKYPKIKKKIDAALNAAADAAGMDRGELEELIVPDHGFVDGLRRIVTSHGSAVLTLDGRGKVSLAWLNAQDKPVKSPPQAMKDNDADAVKFAKALAKEVEADLAVQMQRIDRLATSAREIPGDAFVARYIDHPLIGPACRNIIWRVNGTPASWRDTRMVDLAGQEVPLRGHVTLWHPITADPDTVVAWRDRLEALDVVQPIKQAWREVYAVTDAERLTGHYSNRFAGHIVRQHQTMSLARINGWWATHRMAVDAPNDDPMWTAFPDQGIYVEYWTAAPDVDAPILDSGAYVHLHTDRISFHRLSGDPVTERPEALTGERLAVDNVPPVIFSEVMRHADLIVAVASVAADPAWYDRGVNAAHPSSWERDALDYYERATTDALSGAGEVRRQALARILPRLKIADRLSLAERHVEVQGVKRGYRIHIGSAAVYREPDGQHVCIVPASACARDLKDLRLPFEGDATLSLVLSKAMLLAADDKIKDPIILAQI